MSHWFSGPAMECCAMNKKKYWQLFCSTFLISSFTFGGGFMIVPLLRKKFVEEYQWIEDEEMMSLSAIAQSSPGAIAVNASILVGYHTAGVLGSLISILGTVLPPLIIISIISTCYNVLRNNSIINSIMKGMHPGVCAVIIDVVITMATETIKKKKPVLVSIMVGAFIANYFLKVNYIWIILTAGTIGFISSRRGENKIEECL
jgi:chromate transporter